MTTSAGTRNAPEVPEATPEGFERERTDRGTLRYKLLGPSGLRVSEVFLRALRSVLEAPTRGQVAS